MSEPAFDVIDLARYPIHQEGAARDALIGQVQANLAKDGCAVLKGFLSVEGVASLLKEAEGLSEKGHKSSGKTNAYLSSG